MKAYKEFFNKIKIKEIHFVIEIDPEELLKHYEKEIIEFTKNQIKEMQRENENL